VILDGLTWLTTESRQRFVQAPLLNWPKHNTASSATTSASPAPPKPNFRKACGLLLPLPLPVRLGLLRNVRRMESDRLCRQRRPAKLRRSTGGRYWRKTGVTQTSAGDMAALSRERERDAEIAQRDSDQALDFPDGVLKSRQPAH